MGLSIVFIATITSAVYYSVLGERCAFDVTPQVEATRCEVWWSQESQNPVSVIFGYTSYL